MGVGAWAVLQKTGYAEVSDFVSDPAIIIIAVGCFIFLVSFCGCVGALRENICLLKTVSIQFYHGAYHSFIVQLLLWFSSFLVAPFSGQCWRSLTLIHLERMQRKGCHFYIIACNYSEEKCLRRQAFVKDKIS